MTLCRLWKQSRKPKAVTYHFCLEGGLWAVRKQLLKYYGACNHTPHMLPPRTHPLSVAHRLSLTHLQANAEKITTIFAAFANDAGRVEGDDRIHALYSCCSMAKVHYRSSSAGSAHFCSRSSHTSHRHPTHLLHTRTSSSVSRVRRLVVADEGGT